MEDLSPNSDTHGALPIYTQIAEVIAREISAGHLIDGQRLPTERAMAQHYGVAVGTLRKALGKLTEQGLLERRQGSGNYVRKTENSASIYAFFRLERLGGGGLPTAKLLRVDTVNKPKDLPVFGHSDVAHRFRRVRYLDGIPVALEEIWLDGSVAATIKPGDISQSLYHYYKETLGVWITRVEDWVGVAPTPVWGVDQFPPTPKTPVGFAERSGWSQTGDNIEFSRTWFDPNTARYVARLK